jgi:hypothetical protein
MLVIAILAALLFAMLEHGAGDAVLQHRRGDNHRRDD